ncbi:hypothetical protein ACQW02_07360 [Humitalea sp. 24SJ18S-53]|uniref:hypothetical protein n=1 Tax=Humitalea sp. 24SJ18S-53 TaxID=3422307 RepID=UPI003D668BA4
MRIVTIVARHGTATYTNALDELDLFYARFLPGIQRETIVTDNALPESHRERLADACTLIGGSSAAREFSAWDSAIEFLGDRILEFDFVHLVTAAFQQLYTAYIERFDTRMLAAMRGRAVAIGHVDRYNDPVRFYGRVSQSWIRSSFLFIPPAELRLFGSFVSVAEGSLFFSGDPADPFRADAPLDAGYRQNILGWLTGEGTGQGTMWHSRFVLTAETLPLFEAKTIAVLNEHALSIRLRGQGCAMVDATWLATHVAAAGTERLSQTPIPHWRDQLALRDVDAVPLEVEAAA